MQFVSYETKSYKNLIILFFFFFSLIPDPSPPLCFQCVSHGRIELQPRCKDSYSSEKDRDPNTNPTPPTLVYSPSNTHNTWAGWITEELSADPQPKFNRIFRVKARMVKLMASMNICADNLTKWTVRGMAKIID